MPRLYPLALAALLAAGSGCLSLPEDYPRTYSSALVELGETTLGEAFAEAEASNPETSGVLLLEQGLDALEARFVLADAAEQTLDVQYYIFHADVTGRLVALRLLQAADRGVRVRLLLDDLYASGRDRQIGTLATHPNVEVRVFNPFAGRDGVARFWSALTDFPRINRRMHNKAFIADNQIAIVGGRNVGDEYFDAKPVMNFADLDVLAVGPVVREVSLSFDAFWNDSLAIPITAFLDKRPDSLRLAGLRAELERAETMPEAQAHLERLAQSPLRQQIDARTVDLEWAPVEYVWDGPAKARGAGEEATHVGPALRALAEGSAREALFVTPYLVPRRAGVDFFAGLDARGIRARVLTNSLASTDVPLVHSGYIRYRRPLLRAGVELFEFEPEAEGAWAPSGRALLGSSQASLHAKAYVFDGERLFVTSHNLDPRSDRYNTEVGLIIHSRVKAERAARAFDSLAMPGTSMRVVFARDAGSCADSPSPRRLGWLSEDEGRPVCHGSEPHAGWWERFYTGVLSIVVPDRLL